MSWLEQLHPKEIDLGLERVRQVAARAALLAPAFPVVTVAGTNGKGSVCALLESILTQAGYCVGLYTSPHLFHYNERIRVGAENIGDDELCAAFENIEKCRGDSSLSYFEFGTLAALWLMQQREVDIAVLEVGLGGRLDAVNVWDAQVAIISSLALDHTDWLGDTLDDIAGEKAAIARPGRPLVVGQPDPPPMLFACVEAMGASLWLRGRDYDYRLCGGPQWDFIEGSVQYCALPSPGIGGGARYANAATVVQALHLLSERFPLNEMQLREGLSAARLPGRAQRVEIEGVDCVFDVAHNPQAIAIFIDDLSRDAGTGRIIAVAAFMADKAIPEMLDLLTDVFDCWYVGDLPSSRALSAIALAALLADRIGVQARIEKTLRQAFRCALVDADPQDRVVVFGSFVTVAETLPFNL